MCAISGIIGLSCDDAALQKIMATMKRRGPDAEGIWQEENVTLLHARLAIIDPDGGRQPMQLCWADECYTLVYNGELYNTEELRRELMQKGHCFLDHSDTEVILHAYAEYGDACVDRFNGIFAFAVWESNRKRLFVARDRIGVKPLFFKLHDHGLLFASEIKTILAYPGVKAKLDRTGASQIILLGPGRVPGSGVFQDIQEVEPGYCGYYTGKELKLQQYWKLTDREHRETFEETAAYVGFLVKDAIRRQMVSDVPIGTFLSGGLDSSIITAVCAEQMGNTGQTLKTFSVDYQDNERYFRPNKFQPDSDNTYIRIMANMLGTQHHQTLLSPESLIEQLETATIARDLPGMADVDFSLLAFCADVRREVKAALSGECADEIFGGYPWYRDPEIREKKGFPWAQNTADRSRLLRSRILEKPEEFIMDAYVDTCRKSDILPGTNAQERRIKEMVNLNFRWFMQTLLDRKDRMSMYHGLEVRVPFCDYRIAEYLYGVPWCYKDYQGREKGLLRYAVEVLLPEQVRTRKKSPYPKTFDPRYEQLISVRLQALMEEDSPVWYLIDKEEARKIYTAESRWPWYGQLMRRPQIMAYILQIDFWLKHYRVEFCF